MNFNYHDNHMQEFHIFISSEDSKEIYPANKFNSFTCVLPATVYLKPTPNAFYSVGLTDVCLHNAITGFKVEIPESCVITSNIVEGSIIRNQVHPILCQLWSSSLAFSHTYHVPIYRPINVPSINKITIELLTHNLKEINKEAWKALLTDQSKDLELSVILHFLPQSKII